MKIAYCTNVRLPSERAHGHQIAQVAHALHRLGHRVSIFAPYRNNIITDDFASYYGLPSALTVTRIGDFDPIASPLLPGVFGLWWMNAVLRKGLRLHLSSDRFDLLYTRSPSILSPLLSTGIPTVLELHQLPKFGRRRFIDAVHRCALVVCLTSSMAQTLLSWGATKEKIIVEGDSVDLHRFTDLPSTEEARQKFELRTQRHIVSYVGRLKTLGMEKGVETILQALAIDHRFFGFIVGGPESDRRFYEQRARALGLTAEDVLFTGEIPASLVPTALVAADTLAMPFPDFPHYRNNMSPLKMFEYMASGKPIITSDLPTIRDVLSEEHATFCLPGNTSDFLQSLITIFTHPSEAKERAIHARSLAEKYTWEERMKRILQRFHPV